MSLAQSADNSSNELAASFEALAAVIREWRRTGRLTTTAGIKPALQKATGGTFNETAFGFATFREYLDTAQATGVVTLQQLPTRHWLVLLPGETLAATVTAAAAADHARGRPLPPSIIGPSADRTPDSLRLWPAVWKGFVDWSKDQRRLWDRESHEAFSYPVSAKGDPAWEQEPERFVEIEPANQEIQIPWMRAWAGTLPAQSNQALLASLADDAPPGEYRRQLDRLGLVAEWRAELQRRIAEHAIGWADAHGVDFRELFDRRLPSNQTKRTTRLATRSPIVHSPKPVASFSQIDHTSVLRHRLHSVIEKMSFTELAEIRVPAHLLIDD